MTHEKTRFLAYICPRCRQSVIVEKDVFSLAAAPAHIKCPCGKSELTVEFMPQRVNLTVPCVACGRDHLVSCPSHAFLREKALAFSCAASGLDCCYVGEEGPVYAATARLERAIDKLESPDSSGQTEDEEKPPFLDPLIMEEVLSEIRDIAARGGISCTCGHRGCAMEVHGAAVDLVCPACGGRLRVSAATDEDLDRLCCQYTLTIKGRKEPQI